MNWKVALIAFVTLGLIVVFGQPVVVFFDRWFSAPDNAGVFCSKITRFDVTVKSRREQVDALTQKIVFDIAFTQADGSDLTVTTDPRDFLGFGLNGVVGLAPSGAPSGATPLGEERSEEFTAEAPLTATIEGTIVADPASGTWTLDVGAYGRAQKPLALNIPFSVTIYDLEPCADGAPPYGVYTSTKAFALRPPELAATP